MRPLRAEALLRSAEVATPELERRRAASVKRAAVLLGEVPQTFSLPPPRRKCALTVRTIAVADPAGLLARRAESRRPSATCAATARIGVETAGLYPEVR